MIQIIILAKKIENDERRSDPYRGDKAHKVREFSIRFSSTLYQPKHRFLEKAFAVTEKPKLLQKSRTTDASNGAVVSSSVSQPIILSNLFTPYG